MKAQKVTLPYVNNTRAVLVTLLINLVVVFLFNWPEGITFAGALLDSLTCTAITTVIDTCIVYLSLKKMRAAGQMPTQVPVSRFMQRLPKNPAALGAVYIAAFGALTLAVNALVLWFFGIKNMSFVPWMVYKLIYATILSAKITEYVIFRYVQPDWAGAAKPGETKSTTSEHTVKNPMPKISVFKELYGSVTGNIAMNIIIGTALGGVAIAENSAVVIYPTTVQSIPISGLVFGFITGVLVTNGVVNGVTASIRAAPREGGTLPLPDKRFTWMPKKKGALICLMCACVMPFSAFILWATMTVFGLSVMNFYQFTIFITIYAGLASKPMVEVLTRRCMQPDYILYILCKQNLI